MLEITLCLEVPKSPFGQPFLWLSFVAKTQTNGSSILVIGYFGSVMGSSFYSFQS